MVGQTTKNTEPLVRVYTICNRKWIENSPCSVPLMLFFVYCCTGFSYNGAHTKEKEELVNIMWCCHIAISSSVFTNLYWKINTASFFGMQQDLLHSWIFRLARFSDEAWSVKQKRVSDREAASACLSFSACFQSDRADVEWLLCCWQPALLKQVDQEMNTGRVNTHNWSDRPWKRWNKWLLMHTNPYTNFH